MKKLRFIKGEIKVISRLDELMMDKFIYCLSMEDYRPLIISGSPTEDQLAEAWNTIISAYAGELGSEHYEIMVSLIKEINGCFFKFNRIEMCVIRLHYQYSAVLVKELKRMGYPGEYDPVKRTRYLSELAAAYSKAKTFIGTSKRKQEELKKLEAKAESGKNDRRVFDQNFVALSKHNGYNIREQEISVQKYCIMICALKREIDQKNMETYGRAARK